MSSIYHTEPPTNGKVVLKTTYGDIDIELWSKEAPLACRNFVQLALEGYYDDTNVVRAIKGFMVQMGDPTNTGTGGESIWGRAFKDEIHGRIKFNHRGQVAMANSNKPHSNQSQFFITLDACDWLNGKHTIFGKVTGNTVFNAIRMGEAEVGADDKPVEPIRLLKVEVVWNPFDDIVPRNIQKAKSSNQNAASQGQSKHDKIKATKNSNLLSFTAEEENEEGEDDVQVRFKSVHDMKKRKSGKSKSTTAVEKPEEKVTVEQRKEGSDDFDKKMRDQILEQRINEKLKQSSVVDDNDEDNSDPDQFQKEEEKKRKLVVEKRNEEYTRLKEELRKSKRAVNVLTGEEANAFYQSAGEHALATPLEQRRLKYLKRKHEHGDRSEETFQKLMKFTENIRKKKQELDPNASIQDEVVTYHGQILEKDENEKEEMGIWFAGKLKCKKHIDEEYRN